VYFRLLADAVVLAHFAFVAFVIGGGFLAWRFPRVLIAHVPALLWGIWIELSGRICPLTPLENQLRERAGESGYAGGFIEHYLIPVLYPPGLTHEIQWVLAAALVAANAAAYAGLLVRYRKRARRA
jgi:hypothetical protein